MCAMNYEEYLESQNSSLNNVNILTNANFGSMKLEYYGFIFGAMTELNIVSIIDELLPKQASNVKLSNGESAACVIARLLSKGENRGLYHVSEFFKPLPIAALLGNQDITYNHINEYVIGELLDNIAKYGATEFSVKVFSKLINTISQSDNVKTARIDSSSKAIHTEPDNEQIIALHCQTDKRLKAVQNKPNALYCDKKPTAVNYGYARDGDGSDPQVNIIHLTTDKNDVGTTLPIVSHTYSGNINDVKEFSSLLEETIPMLKQNYPYLKYIIGDCALVSPSSVKLLGIQGMHLLSRMTDNRIRNTLEQAAKGELQFETVEINDEKIEAAWAGEYTFKDPDDENQSWKGRLLAVSASNMLDRKKYKHEKKAAEEMKKIKKKERTLNKDYFNCKIDAKKAALELISQLKYHSGTITYHESKVYGKRGKPAANAEYKLKYSFELSLSLDEQKMTDMIKSESFYVLVTTNTDENVQAKDLIESYHGQYQIERTWRDVKTEGLYIDAIYLKNAQRIRAFMFLQSLALFVANYFMSKVHTFLQKTNTPLQSCKNYKTKRPTWETLLHSISNTHPSIICDFNRKNIMVENVQTSLFLMSLLRYLGFHYLRFYDPVYYSIFYKQIAEQYHDIVESEHEMYQSMIC